MSSALSSRWKGINVEESEWHAWRKAGIGSSDAPIIWGTSPWSTPRELWELKTGRKKSWGGNYATRRGTALEPKARAHYELLNNVDMPAALFTHPTFPWMRASLDGYHDGVVLEIKCPGAKTHAKALAGEIPEEYYPQIQHQLFVAAARRADYFSFDGEHGVCISVEPDDKWMKEYFMKAVGFWNCVMNDTPPPLVDRDWKLKRDKILRADLEDWHSTSLVNGDRAVALFERLFQVHELENRRTRCAGFLIDGFSKKISGWNQQQS